MTGLQDAFGEGFAQEYEQKIAERREERQKVSEEAEREIAHLAINEEKFKDGEPQFQYVTEQDVTHDVLLMQLPKLEGKSIYQYADELQTGAVTCPLDYMGEWMNCLFNNPDDLKEMEPGDHYIVVGNLSTWQPEDGQGEPQDQVSPVRGVISLGQAKEYANQWLNEEVNDNSSSSSKDEPEDDGGSEESSGLGGFGGEDDESEEESDDDSDSEGFLGDDGDEDEEPEVDYDEVAQLVQKLGAQEDEVWELTEDDDERLAKLVDIVATRLELPDEAKSTIEEHALTRIQEEREEEEDDDDDEEDLMF